MTSITTINSGDLITNSRSDINTNFANLNSDKIETSYIDTDTSLAANSDSKIATQKAVKTYIDTSGGQNASETVRGIVEEATDAEVTAGTATGATGAKLFVTPAKFLTYLTTSLAPIAKLIGVGETSNTTYYNFEIQYGTANTHWNWTSVSTPTYSRSEVILGSAKGVSQNFAIDLATGAAMAYTNTKKKIIEWDALIASDTSTAASCMGFSGINPYSSINRDATFGTDGTTGNWYTITNNGNPNQTKTAISTPSAGRHTFRIELTPTVNCKFYVDGTLVATHTTNLPNDATVIPLCFNNDSGSTIITAVGTIYVSIQK